MVSIDVELTILGSSLVCLVIALLFMLWQCIWTVRNTVRAPNHDILIQGEEDFVSKVFRHAVLKLFSLPPTATVIYSDTEFGQTKIIGYCRQEFIDLQRIGSLTMQDFLDALSLPVSVYMGQGKSNSGVFY
jgi:hypothetical protein